MFYFKNKGFTLIEVLISLVILSGSMLIISRIWSGNHQRTQKIAHYHTVVQLMESKIAELEFKWKKINFDSIPKETQGDFPQEKYFSWSVKTQALNLSDYSEIFTNSAEQKEEFSTKIAQLVTQFLSSSILEAKLTIHYKKGKFKSTYSLTTYMVNYFRKISLATPMMESQ